MGDFSSLDQEETKVAKAIIEMIDGRLEHRAPCEKGYKVNITLTKRMIRKMVTPMHDIKRCLREIYEKAGWKKVLVDPFPKDLEHLRKKSPKLISPKLIIYIKYTK